MNASTQNQIAGTSGFVCSSIALVIVLVSIVAGPFAPQQDIGVTIGEIAGEASKSFLRNLVGLEQPAPQVTAWNVDKFIWLAAILAGAVGTLLGALAFLRGERRMLAGFAMALGLSSIAVQLIAGAVMLIIGALILCAIIMAVSNFFEGALF